MLSSKVLHYTYIHRMLYMDGIIQTNIRREFRSGVERNSKFHVGFVDVYAQFFSFTVRDHLVTTAQGSGVRVGFMWRV